MQGDEARLLLGFPPNSRPTPSQIKAAYRKKVWESHPDLFPLHQKSLAESKFKMCPVRKCINDWLVEPKKQAMLEDKVQEEEAHFRVISCLKALETMFSNFVLLLRHCLSSLATYSNVVRTGVPKAHGGRKNRALIQIPFLLIVLGTVGLGGLNATRAYRKQKEACPSHNPFLP